MVNVYEDGKLDVAAWGKSSGWWRGMDMRCRSPRQQQHALFWVADFCLRCTGAGDVILLWVFRAERRRATLIFS